MLIPIKVYVPESMVISRLKLIDQILLFYPKTKEETLDKLCNGKPFFMIMNNNIIITDNFREFKICVSLQHKVMKN